MRKLNMQNTVGAPDWSTIPAPHDDGATRHLLGARMSSVSLHSTGGELVDLSALAGRTIVYAYPRTGKPGIDNPAGWDVIPGLADVRRKHVPSAITSTNCKRSASVTCLVCLRKTRSTSAKQRSASTCRSRSYPTSR
jgi:hypothetical protein